MRQRKEIIGENIRKLRKQNGWTVAYCGERLYVSEQVVSQWERGKKCPQMDRLADMVALFNVPFEEIYLTDEERKVYYNNLLNNHRVLEISQILRYNDIQKGENTFKLHINKDKGGSDMEKYTRQLLKTPDIANFKTEQDVLEYVETLFTKTDFMGTRDPFFRDTEKLLFSSIILYLWKEGKTEEDIFSEILKILKVSDISGIAFNNIPPKERCKKEKILETEETELDLLMKKLEKIDPEFLAVKMYHNFKFAPLRAQFVCIYNLQIRIDCVLKPDKYLKIHEAAQIKKANELLRSNKVS